MERYLRFSLRFVGIALLLNVLAFTVGIAFFVMAFSLILGVLWLSPYWGFARKIVIKTVGPLFPYPVASRVQINWWLVMVLFVKVAAAVVFFVAGVQILLHSGFGGQNLICLMVNR